MISKNVLKKVIADQNEWIVFKKDFLIRERLAEIKEYIKLPHIVVITGPRRSGKSVFLSQIIHTYYKDKSYYYISFDNERLIGFKLQDFDLLLEELYLFYGKSKVIFIDEIQNIDGWERFISRLYNNGFKIFITGSNSKLLSSEISTFLTGRHINIEIYPFSFNEFIKFKNLIEDTENKIDFIKNKINLKKLYSLNCRSKIKLYLEKYIKDGGFPEVVRFNNTSILLSYFSDIVEKDIIKRYKIDKVSSIKEIAKYLISNSGSEISYNKIKNIHNLGSSHTAKNYIGYISSSYLTFTINKFSYSLKEQQIRNKKIYAIDTGLINHIGFSTSFNYGKLYETSVFIHFKRDGKQIYYFKNEKGKEVDFVILESNKVINLIQVCFNLNDEKTKKREITGLISAMKYFNLNEGIIITDNSDKEVEIDNKKIKIVSLWEFLLGLY